MPFGLAKDDVVILRKCPWGAMTIMLGMLIYGTRHYHPRELKDNRTTKGFYDG